MDKDLHVLLHYLLRLAVDAGCCWRVWRKDGQDVALRFGYGCDGVWEVEMEHGFAMTEGFGCPRLILRQSCEVME